MASGNVNIKKGDKIVVTCDIYSKTTCVINQALVSSQHVKTNRVRRNCPIKGCHAAALIKLSNHLRQTHKIQNSNTIQKYLNLAKLDNNILYSSCTFSKTEFQKRRYAKLYYQTKMLLQKKCFSKESKWL